MQVSLLAVDGGKRSLEEILSAGPKTHDSFGRVVIENVRPEIDGGRFPIKRVVHEDVHVTADIFTDGIDSLSAVILYRSLGENTWRESPMLAEPNDLWSGHFSIGAVGRGEYTLEAWVDRFGTWQKGLIKKIAAAKSVSNDLMEGILLMEAAAAKADEAAASELRKCAELLRGDPDSKLGLTLAGSDALKDLMARYSDRHDAARYGRLLPLTVDPLEARFSAWYEMFPRSAGTDPRRSATLREAESRLAGVAAMGFSVVYLPPVHPIGKSFRKGRNNNPKAEPDEPGSPWAIGSAEGGHQAVDPALGTLEDFDHFVQAATQQGLDVALDLAYQCSPDHPYIREHPEWFRHRPDGSIKHAENPPKIYEDIVPFNFECEAWPSLWKELKEIVLFWIGHGIHSFRVDNPHTKPYRFWEWLIHEVQKDHPGTLFLGEAFTRPKPLKYLSKCGFTQSYTYFTWYNTKKELTDYLTELTQTETREYLRPNFFANTPDILHAYLQTGGRAAFQIRLVLAATLSAAYGIYGPAFELCENRALPKSEDYEDSEKYQFRVWDWEKPGHIKELIARVNAARKENAALQANQTLLFCPTDHDQIIAYCKYTPDLGSMILVVVNLDPHNTQWAYVNMPLAAIGLKEQDTYQMHDLLNNARYTWRGERNFVRLDPGVNPAHLFRLERS